MKFQQRLGMLSSAAGLALLYLLLIYSPGVMHVPSGHPATRHRRALSVDYDIELGSSYISAYNPNCDNFGTSEFSSNDNGTIFTQDLPAKTNYKLYGNNQYKMQHPTTADEAEQLKVIILPHSHVDAGWLQTVEEYYVHHVKGILNNMVKKLNKYEDMTFVWAETVFLSMWWNELEDDVKFQVRRLIRNGQLEVVLGGWVMSDEATTYYPSVIDQLMEGHQWVLENLDTKPVSGWVIDPFGHSGTMPYLWKQAGMQNMVIQRVHQAIKATLASQNALEFNWRQNWDFKGNTDILCHVMPYVYYGMQYTCGPDRKICAMYDYGKPKSIKEQSTGREINDKNIAQQAKYLYEQYRFKASLYRYNTIIVPVGDDFRFDTSSEWDSHYENYKKVMEYMNAKQDWNISVKFGTLSEYFDMVRADEQRGSVSQRSSFPVLKGDFFPYSDQNSEYWTGYYSTRPFHKQLSRQIERNIRAVDILSALAYSQCKKYGLDFEHNHNIASYLQEVRRNLGLFLHHDAITGTAKEHVVEDYENKLLRAFNLSQDVVGMVTQNLLSQCEYDEPVVLSTVHIRKDAYSLPTRYTVTLKKGWSKVVFFNPVAQLRKEFVTLLVDSANIQILNSNNEDIPFQISPVFKSPTKIHESEFEVVFAIEIPAFAIQTFTLVKVDRNPFAYWSSVELFNTKQTSLPVNVEFSFKRSETSNSRYFIENDFIRASFNENGMLIGIYDKIKKVFNKVKLNFLSYTSEASGAYLFYPSGIAKDFLTDTKPSIRVIKGSHAEQIEVLYKNLYHSITVYDTDSVQGKGLYVENHLDMGRDEKMANQEVIMRIEGDVKNVNGTYYTDQNGFQMIGRKTYSERRIETNYYPVTSMMFLEDTENRLTLHSQQSHGAASLQQGWLEVMLDRKVMSDDHKGLGEGVFDNRPVISRFIIQLEHKLLPLPEQNFNFAFPSVSSSVLNDLFQQPVLTVFTTVRSDFLARKFHPIKKSLDCDISVVSLKNLMTSDLEYNGTSLILRRTKFDCNFPEAGDRKSVV